MQSDVTLDSYSRGEVALDLLTFTGVGMAYYGSLASALPLATLSATLIATTHQFLDAHKSTSKLIRMAALISTIALTTLSFPLLFMMLSSKTITVIAFEAALHTTFFQIVAKVTMYVIFHAELLFRNTFFFSFPSSLQTLQRADALSLKKELIDFPGNLERASLPFQLGLRQVFKGHGLAPLPLATFPDPGANWTKEALDQLHETPTKHLPLHKRAQIAELLYGNHYPPQRRNYRLDELPVIDYQASAKTLTSNQLVWAHLKTILDPKFPILYPINQRFYNLKLAAPRDAWIYLPPLTTTKDVAALKPHQLSWYHNLFQAQPVEYRNLSQQVKAAFSARLQQKTPIPPYRPPPDLKRYDWKPIALAAGGITLVALSALAAYTYSSYYAALAPANTTLAGQPAPLTVFTPFPPYTPPIRASCSMPSFAQPTCPRAITPIPSDWTPAWWNIPALLFLASVASKHRSKKSSPATPPPPAEAAAPAGPESPDRLSDDKDSDYDASGDDEGYRENMRICTPLGSPDASEDDGGGRDPVCPRTGNRRRERPDFLLFGTPEDTPPPNTEARPMKRYEPLLRLPFGNEVDTLGTPQNVARRLAFTIDEDPLEAPPSPPPVRPPVRRVDSFRRFMASPLKLIMQREPGNWNAIFLLVEKGQNGDQTRRNTFRINVQHGLYVVDKIMSGEKSIEQHSPELMYASWGLLAQAITKMPLYNWEEIEIAENTFYNFFAQETFNTDRMNIRDKDYEGFAFQVEGLPAEHTQVWIYRKKGAGAGAGAGPEAEDPRITYVKFGKEGERFNPRAHRMMRRSSTLGGGTASSQNLFG